MFPPCREKEKEKVSREKIESELVPEVCGGLQCPLVFSKCFCPAGKKPV